MGKAGNERRGLKLFLEKRTREMETRENLGEDWHIISMNAVKERIEESGRARWQIGMEGKSTLGCYKRKKRSEALHWHSRDWGSKLLVKARTESLEVKARNRDEQDQRCSFCRGQWETIQHFLV